MCVISEPFSVRPERIQNSVHLSEELGEASLKNHSCFTEQEVGRPTITMMQGLEEKAEFESLSWVELHCMVDADTKYSNGGLFW